MKSGLMLKARVLMLCLSACVAAQEGSMPSAGFPAKSQPTLRIDTAAYDVAPGVLQFAFTFANPTDSVLFLDCQIPPRAVLEGRTLILLFDRGTDQDAPETRAGGPASGGAFDAADYPPQRIAGGQTFQGRRKLDRLMGETDSRPVFDKLRLEMAYYPERTEGEGDRFVAEKMGKAVTGAAKVAKRGKRPPAVKHTGPK